MTFSNFGRLFNYLYIHLFGSPLITVFFGVMIVTFCFHILYRLMGDRW